MNIVYVPVFFWALFAGVFGQCEPITSDTLKFVHIVWRHGDRSPFDGTFPTDKDNQLWTWPQGKGELTERGMLQHYNLGQYLRKRYVTSGFLLPRYNATEIYVRSTDFNRSIMCAQANLAGMYPPEKDEEFLTGFSWRPIPVHVVPKDNDELLYMSRDCNKSEEIMNDILASTKFEAQYGEFIKFLREKTGFELQILDRQLRIIYDALFCEKIHSDSHKWPEWVTEAVYNQIVQFHAHVRKTAFADTRIQKFRGGLLFKEIAERSKAKAENSPALSPKALKYYAYSAHDTTIVSLLSNLGAYDGDYPAYASAIIFELREKNGAHFINTLYIKETGSETPIKLAVQGCDSADGCALEKFVEIAKAKAPNDWYAACEGKEQI